MKVLKPATDGAYPKLTDGTGILQVDTVTANGFNLKTPDYGVGIPMGVFQTAMLTHPPNELCTIPISIYNYKGSYLWYSNTDASHRFNNTGTEVFTIDTDVYFGNKVSDVLNCISAGEYCNGKISVSAQAGPWRTPTLSIVNTETVPVLKYTHDYLSTNPRNFKAVFNSPVQISSGKAAYITAIVSYPVSGQNGDGDIDILGAIYGQIEGFGFGDSGNINNSFFIIGVKYDTNGTRSANWYINQTNQTLDAAQLIDTGIPYIEGYNTVELKHVDSTMLVTINGSSLPLISGNAFYPTFSSNTRPIIYSYCNRNATTGGSVYFKFFNSFRTP